jgi:hypothetical protein
MVATQPLTCSVIRVTRPDTVLIRVYCQPIQGNAHVHVVLEGIECQPEAKQEIIDWIEIHSDASRLQFTTWEWFRDAYGRVLGDLADLQTGEPLTAWLLERGVAESRPDHYLEILRELVQGEGPEC